MSTVMKGYAAMEKAYAIAKDLGLVIQVEGDKWNLCTRTDEDGMIDIDVEELYVTGTTPFELLQFLHGFEAGLESKKIDSPKRIKKRKPSPT